MEWPRDRGRDVGSRVAVLPDDDWPPVRRSDILKLPDSAGTRCDTPDRWRMDVLEQLQREPLVWLGQRCVFRLAAYLRGFAQACSDLGLAVPALPDADNRFNAWVRTRLGLRSRTHNWPWLIWVAAANDDEAFASFFALWREFRTDAGAAEQPEARGASQAVQPRLRRLLAEERARWDKSPCASLTLLQSTIAGYRLGVDLSGQPIDLDLEEFADWLRRERSAPAGAAWDRALIYASGSDADAFHRFYELIDQFIADERERSDPQPARTPASAPAA